MSLHTHATKYRFVSLCLFKRLISSVGAIQAMQQPGSLRIGLLFNMLQPPVGKSYNLQTTYFLFLIIL